ncbi:hypothetical protein [Sphingomonas prati]|uniref:Uncharacterized protein n=1 Tax=Sphingomonas prati TaxID=1843237 RepID=A0A7W9BVK3_9SPHN|nr:hypothetical protein [Sphingomonas prati]MBB5730933.1 hypothetical protein [Sphingomonas prati]
MSAEVSGRYGPRLEGMNFKLHTSLAQGQIGHRDHLESEQPNFSPAV